MDLSYINEFVILAENQSFSETADRMFLSQSTISKHIKKLEAELGIELFERSSRKVRLTVEGERFLKTARHVSELMDTYISNLQNTRNNTLLIASVPITPTKEITQLLIAFAEKYPELKISVNKGDKFGNIDLLTKGQCNLVFSYNDDELPESIEKIPFFEDELCVLVPADHPIAKRDSVSIEQLTDEYLVLPETGSALYFLSMRLFRDAGITPNIKIQLQNSLGIGEIIECGLGIALYPRSNAEKYINSNRIKVLKLVPSCPIITYILYPKDLVHSSVTNKFIEFVKATQAGNE